MPACDVIIIGAGPAGLTAAATAAAAGLKVTVLEKKAGVAQLRRTCAQAFFTPGCGLGDRYYQEPTVLEPGPSTHRLHFASLGFSLEYRGLLVPCGQFTYVSPCGSRVNRYGPGAPPWCHAFSKASLVEQLLEKALGAGADVIPGAAGVAARETPAGVAVTVREAGRDRTIEARRAIVADGLNSRVVESLGLNGTRRILPAAMKGVAYILDGVDQPAQPGDTAFMFAIPSLTRGTIMLGTHPDRDRVLKSLIVAGGPEPAIRAFMGLPRYATWFARSRLVSKTAFNGIGRTPLREAACGRVIVAGDAAATYETLVAGAIACGCQAGRATARELAGQPGNAEYNAWWLRAFKFHDPQYFSKGSRGLPLGMLCSDEEMDYVYGLLDGRTGDPAFLAMEYMDVIRRDRPALHARLLAAMM